MCMRIANRKAVRTLCANEGPVRRAPPAKCNSKLMSSTTMTTKGNNGGTWHFLLSGFEALIELQLSALSSRMAGIDSTGSCNSAMCSAMITWRCTRAPTRSNALNTTQPLGDVPNGNVFVEIELFDCRKQKSQLVLVVFVCNVDDGMSYGENICGWNLF
jgi:hypothetical protein